MKEKEHIKLKKLVAEGRRWAGIKKEPSHRWNQKSAAGFLPSPLMQTAKVATHNIGKCLDCGYMIEEGQTYTTLDGCRHVRCV